MRRPENPATVPGLLLMMRKLCQRMMGQYVPSGWSLARLPDSGPEDAVCVSSAGQLEVMLFKHSVLVHLDDMVCL